MNPYRRGESEGEEVGVGDNLDLDKLVNHTSLDSVRCQRDGYCRRQNWYIPYVGARDAKHDADTTDDHGSWSDASSRRRDVPYI